VLLKLTLSPAAVAMVTLTGRRWGTRASGVLTSLPVSTGPVLLFFALEMTGTMYGFCIFCYVLALTLTLTLPLTLTFTLPLT